MKRLVIVAALVLGGCETLLYGFGAPPEPFTAPDGRQGYGLLCNRGMPSCYDAARETCGGDFEVLEAVDRQVLARNAAGVAVESDQRLYVACLRK